MVVEIQNLTHVQPITEEPTRSPVGMLSVPSTELRAAGRVREAYWLAVL